LAVAIRLTRVGATKRPAYRVIAIDRRRSRDGRALEILGFYDPLTEPATVQLDTDKIKAWIGKGAQPSDTVVKLMRQAEQRATAGTDAPAPKRATRSAAKPSRKAAAKAATPTEAPAEAEPSAPEPVAADAEAPAEPSVEAAEAPAAEQPTAEEPAAEEPPAAETEAPSEPGDAAPAAQGEADEA
jgi:small subunit ribosomal protein S16